MRESDCLSGKVGPDVGLEDCYAPLRTGGNMWKHTTPVRLVIFIAIFVLAKILEPVIGFWAVLGVMAAIGAVLYAAVWWLERRSL